MKPNQKNNVLKYISLITLTVQNAALGLSMRYARTRSGPMFLSTTAVLMSELVKLLTCLVLVYCEEGNFRSWIISLETTIVKNPIDTLKVSVPSLLYVIQNNLLYLSASHLDAATYQVTYQLKILTTALFAVLILRRSLLKTQWLSLVVLVSGVALVQLAQTTPDSTKSVKLSSNSTDYINPNIPHQNKLIGFSAALGACFISGFAGIYFEKILKGADISVWMRNVQLSLLSIPIGLISCFAKDSQEITQKGFFYGYDWFIWYLIVLQAVGGLLVAMVVKYADNILKGFATSLAIIISCVVSIYLFNFTLTIKFTLGAMLVIFSIFMYGYQPSKAKSPKLTTPENHHKKVATKDT